MSQQLSEEQLSKLKETIRKRIREFTGTANVAGYDTPHAFGKNTKGDKKRKVKSTGKGFELAETSPKKPEASEKYSVTATPKGSAENAKRVTLTKPAPKATAQTQAASFKKMDKYQTIRLKKA